MCKAFSCLVTRDKKVIWEAGVDSHDELVSKYNVRDDTDDMSKIKFARIEIVPDNKERHPYLWPELEWEFNINEQVTPLWLKDEHEKLAWGAWEEWKSKIYTFNYKETRNPVNPLLGKAKKPTDEDIELLKKWASVWASVGESVRESVWESVWASVWESVWASVGASVRESVWESVGTSVGTSVRESVRESVWESVGASVWASVGSLFPDIKVWKFTDKLKVEGYPFQSSVDLWKRGFVPSFDGKEWRLHSGKNAKVVWEGVC